MLVVGATAPTKASYSVCSAVVPLRLELLEPYSSHTKLLNSRFCRHMGVTHGLSALLRPVFLLG